jgi:hypothetical protein
MHAVIVSGIALFLVILFAVFAIYHEPHLFLPNQLTVTAFQDFFTKSNSGNIIALQSIAQAMLMISIILVLFFSLKKNSSRWKYMLCIVCFGDLLLATNVNFPQMVASRYSAVDLNKKLSKLPAGFPLPDSTSLVHTTQLGDGTLAPAWFNNNIFYKSFSRDAYNPFLLINRGRLEHYTQQDVLLDHPVIFMSRMLQPYPNLSLGTIPGPGTVLIPPDILKDFAPAEGSLNSRIHFLDFKSGRFKVETYANQPAALVLQQCYYPGWKVILDGKTVEPFISNFCMMSVSLPAGNHEVEFFYDPTALRWLLGISTACLVSFISVLLFGFDKNQSNEKQ